MTALERAILRELKDRRTVDRQMTSRLDALEARLEQLEKGGPKDYAPAELLSRLLGIVTRLRAIR